MPWWLALPLTLVVTVVSAITSAVIHFNILPIVILGTAIWCAIDSEGIQLTKYKSGISYQPLVLLLAIAFLWIVGFPWYLVVRHRIKTGRAQLKTLPEAGTSVTASPSSGSPSGLLP